MNQPVSDLNHQEGSPRPSTSSTTGRPTDEEPLAPSERERGRDEVIEGETVMPFVRVSVDSTVVWRKLQEDRCAFLDVGSDADSTDVWG